MRKTDFHRRPIGRHVSSSAMNMFDRIRAQADAGRTLGDGAVYRVEHRVGGTFTARVLEDDGSHAVLEVVDGYARRRGGRSYGVGDQFTVLKSVAVFTRIEEEARS